MAPWVPPDGLEQLQVSYFGSAATVKGRGVIVFHRIFSGEECVRPDVLKGVAVTLPSDEFHYASGHA